MSRHYHLAHKYATTDTNTIIPIQGARLTEGRCREHFKAATHDLELGRALIRDGLVTPALTQRP